VHLPASGDCALSFDIELTGLNFAHFLYPSGQLLGRSTFSTVFVDIWQALQFYYHLGCSENVGIHKILRISLQLFFPICLAASLAM
jgi:hypothetical protein